MNCLMSSVKYFILTQDYNIIWDSRKIVYDEIRSFFYIMGAKCYFQQNFSNIVFGSISFGGGIKLHGEKHQLCVNYLQIWSHEVVSSTPWHRLDKTHSLSGDWLSLLIKVNFC